MIFYSFEHLREGDGEFLGTKQNQIHALILWPKLFTQARL